MRRYLPAVFPVTCAFLALATLAAWLYSLIAFFYQPIYCHTFGCLLRSTHGLLLLRFFPAATWAADLTRPLDQFFFLAGFGFWHTARPAGPIIEFALPYWFLLLLFIFPPVRFFHRNTFFLTPRRERIANRLCPTCGYDLRAHFPNSVLDSTKLTEVSTPSSLPARCPECGTPIPANTHPTS